jgi:hypothetical protein
MQLTAALDFTHLTDTVATTPSMTQHQSFTLLPIHWPRSIQHIYLSTRSKTSSKLAAVLATYDEGKRRGEENG